MHICTSCDHKYIHKGLALYQSLKNTIQGDFVLHWLCLDDLIYKKLNDLALPEVVTYNLFDLEDIHPELRTAKNNPPSNYGDAYSQYCWTLTPWFINFLLRKDNRNIKQLLYADSDIFFYGNPKKIFDTIGNDGIGIHTHRFTGMLAQREKLPDGIGTTLDNGWYNVGVVAFNNTPAGINISETWKSWVLNINNPFYKEYGTCGDQKYLELFQHLFGPANVCVFDQKNWHGEDSDICHQGPWCPEPCGNKEILFYHFSHFRHDFEKDTWYDHINEKPEWQPANNPHIRPLYQDYYQVIKAAEVLLQVNKPQNIIEEQKALPLPQERAGVRPDFRLDIIGNIKIDEARPERIKMLIASIRSLAFMKDHCKFILLMQDASNKLQNQVRKELTSCGFDFILFSAGSGNYGKDCRVMLKACKAPFVLNFLEDHFCMLDDLYYIHDLLRAMVKMKVDVLKTTFHKVENNSVPHLNLFYRDPLGFVYDNEITNHVANQKHYGERYFVSVHFIATREFAFKFWNQNLPGPRPHEYEMPKHVPGWEHRCMVPAQELLCSIDDDHGEPGTALLHRPDAKKFWDIYNSLTDYRDDATK